MKSVFDTPRGQCFLCNCFGNYAWYPYTEEHHIFGGTANRKKSEQYGLKVRLCLAHHRGNSVSNKEAVHFNKEMADYLHKIGQEKFEETHTREEFRKEFGKSWL